MRNKRNRSPIDLLELRRLFTSAPSVSFANHVLSVTGTDAADVISITFNAFSAADSSATIKINGKIQTLKLPNLSKAVIHGLGGDDTITIDGERDLNTPCFSYGDTGNDTIRDSNYNFGATKSITSGDSIDGGDGNDNLYCYCGNGGKPATTLNGGNGNDTLYCQSDEGFFADLIGGAGNDTLDYTKNVLESFSGGSGLNTIFFNSDWSGDGDPTQLSIPADVQRVVGFESDPIEIDCSNTPTYVNVTDEKGYETINGGSGNDTLVGGSYSADGLAADETYYINGRGGNDLLTPGPGSINYITGGAGTDSVDYSSRIGNLKVYLDGSKTSTDSNYPGEVDYIDASCERAFGGSGNDLIVASKAGGAALFGFGGNDTLVAQGGTDALWGGDGNDTFLAKDKGKTYINGGNGYNIATIDKLLDTTNGVNKISS